MLNPAVANSLEEIAVELRRVLELDSEVILNPNYFNELSQKIQRDEHYKIIEDKISQCKNYEMIASGEACEGATSSRVRTETVREGWFSVTW